MSESELKTYTLKEIGEHTKKESLWLLIENVVYDVSKFLNEHPGGPEVMIEWAGKDATDAFIDIGHSSDARKLMKNYKIGELCKEDRKGKKETSGSCFWCRMLIPVGVVVASLLTYAIYTRLRK